MRSKNDRRLRVGSQGYPVHGAVVLGPRYVGFYCLDDSRLFPECGPCFWEVIFWIAEGAVQGGVDVRVCQIMVLLIQSDVQLKWVENNSF